MCSHECRLNLGQGTLTLPSGRTSRATLCAIRMRQSISTVKLCEILTDFKNSFLHRYNCERILQSEFYINLNVCTRHYFVN